MHHTPRSGGALVVAAVTTLLAASCASAGKRLEQGQEAEARGDYPAAVARYIDALQKDPDLPGARAALDAAWDSATAGARAAVAEGAGAGVPRRDAVAVAEGWLRLDRLLESARRAGVSLEAPADYRDLRRTALDRGIEALIARAADERGQERWSEARDAYRRIRDAFEPGPLQLRRTLDAEADLLVAWAGQEALASRFRSAFDKAGEALAVSDDIPAPVARSAEELRERALSSGLRVLAVFPVESLDLVKDSAFVELDAHLADILEAGPLRRPPYFVAVADPPTVRRTYRRLEAALTDFPAGRILDELGADFGAQVELTRLVASERDVKATPRSARTRDGRTVSYTLEEGRVRYELTAEVTLFGDQGQAFDRFTLRVDETGAFRRGRYDGSPDELDLGRADRALFSADEARRRGIALQEALLEPLAAQAAEGIFERVLRRIP